MENCGTTSTTTVTAATTTTLNTSASSPIMVKIPIPFVPPEDVFAYVAVKGSLHAQDCSIFGLDQEEIAALTNRFTNGSSLIVNGIMIKAAPLDVINALSKLSYKVVCSSGEAEVIWTLQREV